MRLEVLWNWVIRLHEFNSTVFTLKLLRINYYLIFRQMLDIQTAKKYGLEEEFSENLRAPYFREETILWAKSEGTADCGCPSGTKRYQFTKVGKNFGVDITRYLSIFGSRLYYFQTQNSTLCLGSCELENIYMRWMPWKGNFLLLLSNGAVSSCYFFSSNVFYVENQKALALYTVQLDFYNQFQVLEELGEGSFSTAFRVAQIQTGREFTAKTLPLDSSKIFVHRELQVLRSLVGAQHVSQFWGLFETSEHLIFVTEFVEGRDLMTVINYKGVMSWEEVRTIVEGIAKGLKACHRKKIVHRDLKPQNVVVNLETMKATIIDFGMALDLKKECCEFKKCGTLAYMAPEVFHCEQKNQIYNTKSDWFSLGIIAHLLMLGQNPLRGTLPSPFDRNQKPQCNEEKLRTLWGEDGYMMVAGLMSENPCKRWCGDKVLGCSFMVEEHEYQGMDYYELVKDRPLVDCL